MRAKMSDGYSRLSELCAYAPPFEAPCSQNDAALAAHASSAAEAEARAILAETEGEPHSGWALACDARQQLCGLPAAQLERFGLPLDVADALAESLSRFVALEQLQ